MSHAIFAREIRMEFDNRMTQVPGIVAMIPEDQLLISEPTALAKELAEQLQFDTSFELLTENTQQQESEPGSNTVILEVEFSGSFELVQFQPSRYSYAFNTLNPGKIEGQCVMFSFRRDGVAADQIKQRFEEDKNRFLANVVSLKQEAETQNSSMVEVFRAAICKRKEGIVKHKSLVDELGFPIRRRNDAPMTYKVPDVRRKPAISQAKKSPTQEPEPVLSNEDYEYILSVIKQMTLVMEKSPSAFVEMQEEHLRMHFLVQLNGQYEVVGNALAEVFSYEGKSDIYIERENKNIFIAECAFWKGQAEFQRKVEQLLGYLTWRDTKSALLIFNKKGALSTVLKSIRETIPKLKNFASETEYGSETDFRFSLYRGDDKQRLMHVTVLVFEIPS